MGQARNKLQSSAKLSKISVITRLYSFKTTSGISGIDFSELSNSEYSLAKIFNQMWPGDPIKQLCRLNKVMAEKYSYRTPVTLDCFFLFRAFMFLATLVGYRGKKLWKPATNVQGIIKAVDAFKLMGMSLTEFNCIKGCIVDSFTPNATTKPPAGKNWCPILTLTPMNDNWGPVQALVNEFNDTRSKFFRASNQKIFDESMSGFKP